MKTFKTFFSKFKINRGGRFLGFGLSPEGDWKIIIITFMVLLSFAITACAYYFIQVNSGNFSSTQQDENTPSSSFNLSRVRQTINYYEGKSKDLENIKNTPENILDPSI